MKLYRVLGDVAFQAGLDRSGNPVHTTASSGEIVRLNPKDAAALLARGDVVEHGEEPAVMSLLPPAEE